MFSRYEVTRSLRLGDAWEVDVDEPLEGVLVHGVHVGHVGHAEEQDLCVDSHRDVLTARQVDVALCLLRDDHLGLKHDKIMDQPATHTQYAPSSAISIIFKMLLPDVII